MTQTRFTYEGQTGPWEVLIGLEVHCQIHSASKLFSGAATTFGAAPNTQVDFFDAGFPGMLPVMNETCVAQAVKTGLGLHGQINLRSLFDRKNYFYPDLPSGYQISQHTNPIITGGYIDIDTDAGDVKRIDIERLHIETDAGKSIHDQDPSHSFIDLNRSGVALMEIVTAPAMHNVSEVSAFFNALRTLVRYLETCDGNMEQGSMRADVNVSVNRPGEGWGTRCEIKNLNSVRFMTQAIHVEAARQIELLEAGESILQETRLFDPVQGETRSMRSKEDAMDYRYFPDPDLPPLVLSAEFVKNIRDKMPELPGAKKARFMTAFGLPAYDASVLTGTREIAAYFEAALASMKSVAADPEKASKILANWAISEVFALLNQENLTISQTKVTPENLGELVDLILKDTISGKIAKEVFSVMWQTGKTPGLIVKEKGLEQVSDEGAIEASVSEILDQNPDKVADYRGGKDKLFGFFVGQVMKVMAGKANPKMVNDIIRRLLDETK